MISVKKSLQEQQTYYSTLQTTTDRRYDVHSKDVAKSKRGLGTANWQEL